MSDCTDLALTAEIIESRPLEKKLDGCDGGNGKTEDATRPLICARLAEHAKDRVKLSEILLNGSAVKNTERGDERKEWVSPTHMLQLQLNCIHRADSERPRA